MSLVIQTSQGQMRTNFVGLYPITGVVIGNLEFNWDQFCQIVMYVLWEAGGRVKSGTVPAPVQKLLNSLYETHQTSRVWMTNVPKYQVPQIPTIDQPAF